LIDISPSEYLERKNRTAKVIALELAAVTSVPKSTLRFFRIGYLLPFSTLIRGKDGPLWIRAPLDSRSDLDLRQTCNNSVGAGGGRDDLNINVGGRMVVEIKKG
jgi:hypothetical protein